MRIKYGETGKPCVAYNPKTGHVKIPKLDHEKSDAFVNAFIIDDDEYIPIMYNSYEELNAKLNIAKELAKDGNSMFTIEEVLSYTLPKNI